MGGLRSFIGNTGTSVYDIPINQGCTLESFTIVNTSGSSVVQASLAINTELGDFNIISSPTYIYDMIESSLPRVIDKGQRIHLTVNGMVDYNFNYNA